MPFNIIKLLKLLQILPPGIKTMILFEEITKYDNAVKKDWHKSAQKGLSITF